MISDDSQNPTNGDISRRSLAQILWTYSYAYTAAHDFSVSDQIMVDDYVLRMGEYEIRGRREEYQPATQRQYSQYPTLGFTVHRLITNGERAALSFSEHGRSIHDGRAASWQGISLYRWDRARGRLTECRVEQDYYSRRQQLDSGKADPVRAPGIDPWSTEQAEALEATEQIVQRWLKSNEWLKSDCIDWDDGGPRPLWRETETEVLDIFSAGSAVAFHVHLTGYYLGGLPSTQGVAGMKADLYATGLVDVGQRLSGQIVTDRHGMLRRLKSRT